MNHSESTSSHAQKYIFIAILLTLGPSLSSPAPAQDVYGTVLGRVTDSFGQPIRGALITAVSLEKGIKERATSNASGLFSITHLVSDTYNITAEAPGYQAWVLPAQELYAEPVDLKCQLPKKGSATGPVQPSVASPLLKTDRADVSTTLSLQEVEDLPNFQRNFTAYQLLTPGALPVAAQVTGLRPYQDPQQAMQVNQNGQHFSGSDFQLDGTENRDPIAGIAVINPSLESLSEMKITTQNFDAEFGQTLAGLVTAQTRSGSNLWHGAGYEIRGTDWGAAGSPIQGNPNAGLDPFKTNLFGGSVGGPLIKNRLFFFGDYQGHRRVVDASTTASTIETSPPPAPGTTPPPSAYSTCISPTSTSMDCDLSEYGTPYTYGNANNNGKIAVSKIYNPLTGMPFGPDLANNCLLLCIPKSMLSSQAVTLLRSVNLPPANLLQGKSGASVVNGYTGYVATGAEPWNDDTVDLRLDRAVSEKFKVFGRYSIADFRISANALYGNLPGGPGLSTDLFAGTSHSLDQNISSGFNYTFGPKLNMDFRFGYYRYHLDAAQNGLNTNPATAAGIPNMNLRGNEFTSGMPTIVINDASNAGGVIALGYGQAQICGNCPLREHEQEFQFANNWLEIHGAHSIKWGADFRYAENLRFSGDQVGSYTASSAFTGDGKGANDGTGLGLATFLLGYITSFDRFTGENYNAQERQNRLFFYGQDTWRASQRLTFTYGLRWEIYMPQGVNAKGNGGFLDLATGEVNVAGYGPYNLHGNVENNFGNFAPRLGLAYQINPRTVIRAGYGRSFDLGYAGAVFGETVTQNPPVVNHQVVQPSSSAPTTCTTTPTGGSTQYCAFRLDEGPPVSPPPTISGSGQVMFPMLTGPPTSILPNGIQANALPSQVRVPTIDSWNFTVQHQLTPSMFLELAYVGDKGTHLFPEPPASGTQIGAYNINEATIQGYLLPYPCSGSGSTFTCMGNPPTGLCVSQVDGICVSSTLSRQPYAKYGWTQSIYYFGNSANDSYQAMQAKLEKRFKQGLQFRATYTWSKSLANAPEYFDINPKLEYGLSDFDRTHAFTLSSLWNLPIGQGRLLWGNASGFLSRAVSGWSLNTVTRVYSGLPFTPIYNECSSDIDTGPCRPNVVGPVHTNRGSITDYFTNTSSFGSSSCATNSDKYELCPGKATLNGNTITYSPGNQIGPWERAAPGTFGNAGYNSLRGPFYWDTDLAILKNISLTERYNVQFRMDVANVFNIANYDLPTGCVDCAGAGNISNLTVGATMRQFEFALKLTF